MTIAGSQLWTEDEVAVLHMLSPRYDEIRERLHRRTRQAIRVKCNELGLPTRAHIWTCAEIAKLRRLYRSASKEEVLSAFPFSKWRAIQSVAWRNGIRRERPPFKPSTDPLMNSILRRCAMIGWSLIDLDAECGTGNYFRDHSWRRNKPNAKAVLIAVEVLGGRISIKWDD